jgi:hypothetical protein
VCPFECCTYREWEAGGDITVHKNRRDESGVVFRLHLGERVDGVDGVVVTEKPGVVTIDRAVHDGYIQGADQPQLSLKPGELVYVLSPLGEGSYPAWMDEVKHVQQCRCLRRLTAAKAVAVHRFADFQDSSDD